MKRKILLLFLFIFFCKIGDAQIDTNMITEEYVFDESLFSTSYFNEKENKLLLVQEIFSNLKIKERLSNINDFGLKIKEFSFSSKGFKHKYFLYSYYDFNKNNGNSLILQSLELRCKLKNNFKKLTFEINNFQSLYNCEEIVDTDIRYINSPRKFKNKFDLTTNIKNDKIYIFKECGKIISEKQFEASFGSYFINREKELVILKFKKNLYVIW